MLIRWMELGRGGRWNVKRTRLGRQSAKAVVGRRSATRGSTGCAAWCCVRGSCFEPRAEQLDLEIVLTVGWLAAAVSSWRSCFAERRLD